MTLSAAAAALLALSPPIGTQHRSAEAQQPARPACVLTVSILHGLKKVRQDAGPRLFPEWLEVGRPLPPYGTADREPATLVVLEGEVAGHPGADEGPYLAHEEVPASHYTHDFNFDVKPDAAHRNLLGILPRDAQHGGGEERQKLIEVEWESGLGQSNSGNDCAAPNQRGESCGFFSAAHKRHDKLWAWPTAGDRVHVEGLWTWDRGHPPAHTEIHPPRLVAVQRRLPSVLGVTGGSVLTTRADIFASGDGGAIVNNRPERRVPLRRVKMSEKDYSFVLAHPLPGPHGAKLRWTVETHAGDTFPGAPTVEPVPAGPFVRVTIPWRSRRAPDTAIFARSVHLYWDDARSHGVSASYKPRFFRVQAQGVRVNKTQETLPLDAGELRVFADLGGQWLFLNEFAGDGGVLDTALGKARKKTYPLTSAAAVVVVPPGGSFRVWAGGWEADGTDRAMGHVEDPNPKCDAKTNAGFSNAATSILWHGGVDDPIGDVEWWLQPDSVAPGKPLAVEARSAGKRYVDEVTSQKRAEKDVFRLQFKVEEIGWP